MNPPNAFVDIENPLEDSGWRISRPDDAGALHTEVLRELCDSGHTLHVGGAGERGVPATLQLVDVMRQRLVLTSAADGIEIARALQARPAWAAVQLHSLRVQFALMAASAARQGAGGGAGAAQPFLIQAHWPREIYRRTRRRGPRVAGAAPTAFEAPRAPVARFHESNQLVSTRDCRMIDVSEGGAAVLLPAGMAPPSAGSRISRIELDLGHDDGHVVITDATVLHVSAIGRRAHRIGCRWEGMPSAGQRMLRRWLAKAGERAKATEDLATR